MNVVHGYEHGMFQPIKACMHEQSSLYQDTNLA